MTPQAYPLTVRTAGEEGTTWLVVGWTEPGRWPVGVRWESGLDRDRAATEDLDPDQIVEWSLPGLGSPFPVHLGPTEDPA